jgi:hypothetical protein
MPPPISRYHEPPPVLAGSISAVRHSRFSSASVPLLLNRYDVILLDPQKHPEARQQAAHRFADWLVSS